MRPGRHVLHMSREQGKRVKATETRKILYKQLSSLAEAGAAIRRLKVIIEYLNSRVSVPMFT